jgi:glycosyltransferase involved in cell wall biosynthesis
MLYHPAAMKGAGDALSALELARTRFPTLQAVFFGTSPRPRNLPAWIEYHRQPSQEILVGQIYNGSSIYVSPTWTEGFGLPPAEAMACGCAVVSTDTIGVRDFCEHEVTALLSAPKNPEALAHNIARLLASDPLRIKLAESGHARIQEFARQRSVDLFADFLNHQVSTPATESPS